MHNHQYHECCLRFFEQLVVYDLFFVRLIFMSVSLVKLRPGRCPEIPEILKYVLKLELGPEICTYILKFSRVFTFFFKNTHHFSYFTYE